MNLKEFKKNTSFENENTIAIDFDGVIHKNSKGFHDGTIYDKPIENVKNSLEYLSKSYKLIVYSCKANPERPLINGKTGTELIWEWLEIHSLNQYIENVTYDKPNARYYIDDKGIRFNSWDDTLRIINILELKRMKLDA